MWPGFPRDDPWFAHRPAADREALLRNPAAVLLQTLLPLAVAGCLEVVRHEDWDTRKRRLDRLRDRNPQWGGYTFLSEAIFCRMPGKTKEAFCDLALALAIMSFAPGGVRFLGMHWEETC
jgi:hypothetical protein